MSTFIGIEIGGTKLQLVAGDSQGHILKRLRFHVAREKGGAGIREQIETALPGLVSECSASSIGVGFGGPVDWRTGRICCSHQIEGWSEFPLGEWLKNLSGIRVRVDNDANVATLGEACFGAGRHFNPVFYVTLGSGVGGGLVVDSAIYHGAQPGESEIGHVRLDRNGTIVENRCSGWAVDRKIRQAESTGIKCRLTELLGPESGGESRHLSEALSTGDKVAQHILDETAEDLAFALSHVVHLQHPEVIILGGGLSLIGDPLKEAVAQHLPRFIMEAFHPGPQIRLAALREDSVPVGALALAAGSI